MPSGCKNACEVAVVGAGPYGLSAAAHLRHNGVSTQVFGEPMSFWRRNTPKGMMLRSPWRATHISDPQGRLSLDAYAAEHGLDADQRLPVESFVAYGEWFQRRAVPEVDRRTVRLIDATANDFRLTLTDGEILSADRVVVATGLRNQEFRPPPFRDLPATVVTHSCEHADFAAFRGRRVAVIGRGQSACESAALLAEAGADVEIIVRGDIHWLGTANVNGQRSGRWRLRRALASPSEVGPFPASWLVELPGLVGRLPGKVRDELTRRCLKPGAAAWLKPRFTHVTCTAGRLTAARAVGDAIALDLENTTKIFDHVVLGTGYRVDIARLGILTRQLREAILCADGSPLLRPAFESSVPRLHFVGSFAVKSFGPLLRFVAGAPHAARAVTNAARGRAAPRAGSEFPLAHRIVAQPAANLSPPQ